VSNLDDLSALVLAAGRGRRMEPLSLVLPKPALPLPEGAVISWPIRLAAHSGARRPVVNTWHLADRMERALDEAQKSGVAIAVSREPELMGSAGGLALARERGLLGDCGPALVLNGDGVLSLALGELLEHHRRSGCRVTLALLPHLDPERWSRVLVGGDDLVTAILKPGTPEVGEVPLLYPGVMVVSRKALNSLPVEPGELGDRLWQPALEHNQLGGVVVSGHWREVGTPADYLAVAMSQLSDRSLIDPSATVSSSSSLDHTYAGRDACIEASAVVTESVLTEGAVVRSGARVVRSVLMGPVEIVAGESVVDEFRTAPVHEN
jgi:NDP-sugar pyrophosphorylase family protein